MPDTVHSRALVGDVPDHRKSGSLHAKSATRLEAFKQSRHALCDIKCVICNRLVNANHRFIEFPVQRPACRKARNGPSYDVFVSLLLHHNKVFLDKYPASQQRRIKVDLHNAPIRAIYVPFDNIKTLEVGKFVQNRRQLFVCSGSRIITHLLQDAGLVLDQRNPLRHLRGISIALHQPFSGRDWLQSRKACQANIFPRADRQM